jgi:hypothetical protein
VGLTKHMMIDKHEREVNYCEKCKWDKKSQCVGCGVPLCGKCDGWGDVLCWSCEEPFCKDD